MRKQGFKAALFLLLLASPLHAEPSQELKQVEQQLAVQKEQADALAEKEQAAANELQDIKRQLIAATEALQAKQAEQDQLEEQLDGLEQDIAARTRTLSTGQKRLELLTSTLIKISRQPPEAQLLQNGLTQDNLHRGLLLRSALPALQEEVAAMGRDLAELATLRERATAQKQRIAEAQSKLIEQRKGLDAMVQTRQGLLQQTAEQKAALAQQLAALTAEAKDLRQLLEKVNQAALWQREKQPTALKAGLRLPVTGRLLRGYGDKDRYGVASPGLTLAAAPNSPVVAPQDGRVVFAGPFRGYGKIVILQHSGGYHSFLAGFGRIDTEVGQSVTTGEPLGTLPAGSGAKLELYFEWRHHGETVNPTLAKK